jgi:hypothetical protein
MDNLLCNISWLVIWKNIEITWKCNDTIDLLLFWNFKIYKVSAPKINDNSINCDWWRIVYLDKWPKIWEKVNFLIWKNNKYTYSIISDSRRTDGTFDIWLHWNFDIWLEDMIPKELQVCKSNIISKEDMLNLQKYSLIFWMIVIFLITIILLKKITKNPKKFS